LLLKKANQGGCWS